MARLTLCILLLGSMTIFGLGQDSGGKPDPRAPVIKNDAPATPARDQPPALNRPNSPAPTTPAQPATPKKGDAEDEVITVDTNLVTTPVSVLDRNGRFIPGLKKKDFKILENGVPQRITYFRSEEQPFTVILMIDTSPSTKYKMDEIHYAAVTFVNQLRPNDKVLVVAFDSRVKLLTPEPTSERQKLYAAIYKSQFGSGTGLYDAIDAVVNLDPLKIPGRKAVVIFTDGVDTTSRRASFESTIAAVEEIDALIYPIRYDTMQRPNDNAQTGAPGVDLSGVIASLPGLQLPRGTWARARRGQSPAEYEKGKVYLETLAASSGGRMFDADTVTNLEASFAGIAEELRRQYSVGYYPEDTGKPGERRKIKIQVSRPKVVVRAKSSYVIKQS